jgi:hypothetical protein
MHNAKLRREKRTIAFLVPPHSGANSILPMPVWLDVTTFCAFALHLKAMTFTGLSHLAIVSKKEPPKWRPLVCRGKFKTCGLRGMGVGKPATQYQPQST